MQNLYESSRVKKGMGAAFLIALAICGLLLAPALYAVPTRANPPTSAERAALAIPSDPSNLTATAVSSARINLAWTDNSSDEDGFKIERKIGAAGTYKQIATVAANVTSFANTGLSASTEYFYRVRAHNADGNSGYSNEASATTLPKPPAAPFSLAATAVSKSQINLAWADTASNEDGFKIERKIGATGTYNQIATVGANVTSFSHTGLSANTTYFYRVRAHNAGGNSAYSNEASATTLPNAPAAPSDLTATTVSKSQIDLAWTDNSGNEDGFKIERKIGVTGTYSQIATVGANVTSFASTGLNPNTQYTYRVRAFNAGGNSAYSNTASATTLRNPPVKPSDLTATAVGSSQIDLAWSDNAGNEDGFKIESKIGAAGTYAEIATVGANVTNFSNTGLAAGTEYFYRVRAFNNGGHSAYSNEANATTLPNPPAAPSSLTATAISQTQIDLAWSDNAGNEDGFKIESKIGAAGTYAEIATVGANVTNFSNTGLAAGTEYFYRVRAFNNGGHSAYSNEANATTLPNPPAAPSSLTATAISQTQIDLAWSDNANNEDGFKIESKIGAAGTYAEIATVGANVTNFSNTGLAAGTEYFYRVRAFNNGGHSAYSNEANATTLPNPPAAPSSLTATAISQTQIDLAWSDNAGNEDGFKIESKIGAAGTYAEIATVGANVTNFSNTGLAAGTEYFYRVRAFNNGGHSAYSNEANATTLPNPPAAPSSLTATAISQTQIDLAWSDNANNEDGFKIESKIGAAGTYAEIATVGANVTNFSNTGLAAGTEYFYRVRAFNNGGHSAYSNEANATTLPNPPAAPSSLTATAISQTQIDLAWSDNAGNEDGFKIESKIGAAGTYAEIATVGANVTNFSNTGLAAGTEYFYRVRAFNNGGHSAYSNEANATTLPNPPTAPGNLTATALSNVKITLSWADNSNNESSFRIERKLTGGTYAEIASVGANVTSYVDSGLTANTTYFYRVRASNAGGHSAYSNEANATTPADLPAPPSGLTATAISNTQINLAWTDNSSDEISFRIEAKLGAGGAYEEIDSVGANVTSYSSTGLDPGTQYFYRVRASSTTGHSAYSNEANATTLPDPPAAPSDLAATAVSNSQIDLSWTDNSANEQGFKIESKLSSGLTFVQIATVGPNVTSYSNTGLSTMTSYTYRVRAFNAGGNSAYSNTSTSTTFPNPPAAPSNLTAAAVSQTQINLAWTDNATTENGFKVDRKTGAAGTYAEVATLGPDVNAYSDNGLSANTQYFYRVRAFNSGGSSPSNEANATTLPNPPAAPSALTATPVSQIRINLAWTDNSNNETAFKVERKTGAAGTYAEIGTVAANVQVYADSNLTANTAYFYRVRGLNTGGFSDYSNEANATTLPNPPASAPSSLTTTVAGSNQVNLAWTDNSNDEDGFKIERKDGATGTFAQIATVGSNITSFSNTGLTDGVTYFYRVRAFNTGGNSGYSNEASATPSSGSNFALNKPATASSTDTMSATSRAVDGSLTTFWRSGPVNAATAIQWFRVELHPSIPITIGRVVINWYQTYFANEFEVQVSNDGTNWTTVHTNNAGAAGTQTATFTAVAARYVRLYMKKNNKGNYRVADFEVYGGVTKAAGQTAQSEVIVPETIALAQNYPNPFNPSTTISYSLPEAAHVTLKVINMTGQEVATLVNGYQDRGVHSVKFHARKLPSGTYYAVLKTGNVTQTRRMVLAK
ncbi:MAG: fibronectin type III domain-containing protein [candidate division KSB1 bacterium]|nr:fibronectin type III domain-containing protein [candidate division KSB1 bacterium]